MIKKIIILIAAFISILADGNFLKEDRKISKDIYKLISKIEYDQSLLCDKYKRYNLSQIKELIYRYSFQNDSTVLTQLEDLFQKASILYKKDINYGCLKKERFANLKEENRDKNIQGNPIYLSLKNILYRLIKIKKHGGWEKIDGDFYILKVGDVDEAVLKIKKRLMITKDYSCKNIDNLFDKCLEDAVKRFQKRHGLKADGKVGPKTLKKLNISIDKKILLTKLNLERLRWILDEDRDFILVNIPDFMLYLYKNGEPILSMKAIVGKKDRMTPIMRDFIKYAVLNPYWKAPKTVVKEDIFPKLKKGEFDYLKRKGIFASLNWDGNEIVKIEDIDWSSYNEENIPFVFIQKPGPKNFLGFVKFVFPNSDDIYIHDTPDQNLFNYSKRMFSSGCVRIEKPIELFYNLYNFYNFRWRYRTIYEKMIEKKSFIVSFEKKIRVYLAYLTVFEDENKDINFRDDIYEIDKKMLKFIKKYK